MLFAALCVPTSSTPSLVHPSLIPLWQTSHNQGNRTGQGELIGPPYSHALTLTRGFELTAGTLAPNEAATLHFIVLADSKAWHPIQEPSLPLPK